MASLIMPFQLLTGVVMWRKDDTWSKATRHIEYTQGSPYKMNVQADARMNDGRDPPNASVTSEIKTY